MMTVASSRPRPLIDDMTVAEWPGPGRQDVSELGEAAGASSSRSSILVTLLVKVPFEKPAQARRRELNASSQHWRLHLSALCSKEALRPG